MTLQAVYPLYNAVEKAPNPPPPIKSGPTPAETFYGVASPGAGTGVVPTAVATVVGPVPQDDYATLAAASYPSTSYTPPPVDPARVTYAGQVTGANRGTVPLWLTGTTYAMGDIVAGVTAGTQPLYQSIVASNLANTPASSPTKWRLVGPTAVGPAFGAAFSNPGLLPLWTSAAIIKGKVVGYVSINATYYIGHLYVAGTTYAEGTFVIGTDMNVYMSLQGSNVGNSPLIAANLGVYWDLVNTTFDKGANSGASYVVGQLVLQDGVTYVCVSTVTTNRPDIDSTDWTATTVTANPWLVGSAYTSGQIVVYNNTYWISSAAGSTGKIPGSGTGTSTGVGSWTPLYAPTWNSDTTYVSGTTALTFAYVTLNGVLYNVKTGQTIVGQNPRINNQLQFDSSAADDNLPTTVLWNAVGRGPVVPYRAIAATTNNLPDANNNVVGTGTWWTYLNTAALGVAGGAQLARTDLSYGPQVYGDGTTVTDWITGGLWGPANVDSPVSRTDFNTVVAKIVITVPTLTSITAVVATAVVTDNNGNALTPGRYGVGPIVWTQNNTTDYTISANIDGSVTLTGASAGSATTLTATIGSRSASITPTLAT